MAEDGDQLELEAELKKVWGVADKNGDGSISFEELGELIRQLNKGKVPTAAEVARVMELLTKEGSTEEVITWEAFRKTMLNWLTPVNPGDGKKRGRDESEGGVGSTTATARKRIHSTITNFFTQFSKKDKSVMLDEAVMAQLREEPPLDPYDPAQRRILEESKAALSSRLSQCIAAKAKISDMKDGLYGSSPTDWLRCCNDVYTLLSIADEFNSSSLSIEVSREIIDMYHQVRDWAIPQRLVALLDPTLNLGDTPEMAALRKEIWVKALDCLFQFILGPRQPHTPKDHPWHQSRLIENKAIIISRSGVPGVEWIRTHMELSLFPDVRRSAAALLGALGAHDAKVWEFLIASKVPQAILNRMNHPTAHEPIENAATFMQTVSILCGETHPPGSMTQALFQAIDGSAILSLLARLIQDVRVKSSPHGPEILTHIVNAFSHLLVLPFVLSPHRSLLDVLIRLPATTSFWEGPPSQLAHGLRAITAVLRCLRRLLVLPEIGPECVKHMVADMQIVRMLEPVLARVEDVSVQLGAVMVLEPIIAGGHPEVVAPVMHNLLMYLQANSVLSTRVAKLLILVADSGGRVISELVNRGLVRQLFDVLSNFAAADDLLLDMYEFSGTQLNFDLGLTVLTALNKILVSGSRGGPRNPFAKQYSLFGVDQVKRVLEHIITERRKYLYTSWAYETAAVKVEELACSLLSGIANAHQSFAESGDSTSREVLTRVKQLETDYQRAKSTIASVPAGALPASGAGSGSAYAASSPYLVDSSNTFMRSSVVLSVPVIVLPRRRPKHEAKRFSFPRNIRFHDLLSAVSAAFGVPVRLFYERETDVEVPVSTQDALEAAFRGMEAPPRDPELRLIAEQEGYSGTGYGLVPYGAKPLESFDTIAESFRQYREKNVALIDSDLARSIYEYYRTKQRGVDALTYDDFHRVMRDMGVKGSDDSIRAYFTALDSLGDRDGTISVQELILGLSILQKGSYQDRLHLAFRAYDTDGDGKIEFEEMVHMVRSTLKLTDDIARETASAMFRKFDVDRTGALEFDEFSAACRENPPLVEAFLF